MARPDITTIKDRLTRKVVLSPKTIAEMITVNTGAVLFTVSAKETGTYQRAYTPKTRVEYLNQNGGENRRDKRKKKEYKSNYYFETNVKVNVRLSLNGNERTAISFNHLTHHTD